jgi:hypothetical protein
MVPFTVHHALSVSPVSFFFLGCDCDDWANIVTALCQIFVGPYDEHLQGMPYLVFHSLSFMLCETVVDPDPNPNINLSVFRIDIITSIYWSCLVRILGSLWPPKFV